MKVDGRVALMAALCFGNCICASATDNETQLFERYEAATVCITVVGELYNGSSEVAGRGTAFFVNSDRIAVTNSHVLSDFNLYKSVKITGRIRETEESPDVSITLTRFANDEKNDLALLRADAPVPSRYVLSGESRKMRVGSDLLIIGCPLRFGQTLTTGRLGNIRDDPKGRWITETPINPGNSGGPVLNGSGYVVGIASGAYRAAPASEPIFGINIVIPMQVALDGIFKEQGIRVFPNTIPTVIDSYIHIGSEVLSSPLASLNLGLGGRLSAVSNLYGAQDGTVNGIVRERVPALALRKPASGTLSKVGAFIAFEAAAPAPDTVAPSPYPDNITGAITAKFKKISKAFEIRQLKEDHAKFSASDQSYRFQFRAETGYRIERFAFDELSRKNGSPPQIDISPDGKQVDVRFSLTSGPQSEPYRGWLTGTILTKQVKE